MRKKTTQGKLISSHRQNRASHYHLRQLPRINCQGKHSLHANHLEKFNDVLFICKSVLVSLASFGAIPLFFLWEGQRSSSLVTTGRASEYYFFERRRAQRRTLPLRSETLSKQSRRSRRYPIRRAELELVPRLALPLTLPFGFVIIHRT